MTGNFAIVRRLSSYLCHYRVNFSVAGLGEISQNDIITAVVVKDKS